MLYKQNSLISSSTPSRMTWEAFCQRLQNIPHLLERVAFLYSKNLNCLQDSIRKQIPSPISSLKEIQNDYSSVFLYFKKNNVSKNSFSLKAKNMILWIISAYEAISEKDLKRFLPFDWLMVSTLVPFSDPHQIKYKIYTSLKQTNVKAPWSSLQISSLKKALMKIYPNIFRSPDSYPTIKWSKVCFELCNEINDFEDFKTDKQCKEMWCNHLNPLINKSNWSLDDEIMLLEKTLVYGTKWAEISKNFLGRNQHQTKNRFYIVLKRELDISKSEIRKTIADERINALIVKALEALPKTKGSEEETKNNSVEENSNQNSFNFLNLSRNGFEEFFFPKEKVQEKEDSKLFEIECENEGIFSLEAFKDLNNKFYY